MLVDPLLMNAFNMVNLAAACILTSTDYAKELGIPEEKWIYPLSGAGYRDSDHCTTSPPPLVCLEYMLSVSSLGPTKLPQQSSNPELPGSLHIDL